MSFTTSAWRRYLGLRADDMVEDCCPEWVLLSCLADVKCPFELAENDPQEIW